MADGSGERRAESKEILRIIVDSASTSKIIQHEVVIAPEIADEDSSSAPQVDISSALSLLKETGDSNNDFIVSAVTAATCSDQRQSDDESDVSCSLGL